MNSEYTELSFKAQVFLSPSPLPHASASLGSLRELAAVIHHLYFKATGREKAGEPPSYGTADFSLTQILLIVPKSWKEQRWNSASARIQPGKTKVFDMLTFMLTSLAGFSSIRLYRERSGFILEVNQCEWLIASSGNLICWCRGFELANTKLTGNVN